MNCKKCGGFVAENSTFCPSCGEPTNVPNSNQLQGNSNTGQPMFNQPNYSAQINPNYNQVNNNNQYQNAYNQTSYQQTVNNANYPKKNNKKLFIILGIAAVVILLIVLYFAFFKKDKNINSYEDLREENEKIQENINKNFTIKDYELASGILVELTNNNDKLVYATVNVEFYDENDNIIDLKTENMYVDPKSKNYEKITLYDVEDINYSTYKVSAKLTYSKNAKSYSDKIEILSYNTYDDYIIVKAKNNANKTLSFELGALFMDENNSIIDFEDTYFIDVFAGETATEKIYVPYDNDADYLFEYIDYHKVDIKVIEAVDYEYETK